MRAVFRVARARRRSGAATWCWRGTSRSRAAVDRRPDAPHPRHGVQGARRPEPGRPEARGPLARVHHRRGRADAPRRAGDRPHDRGHGHRAVLPGERGLHGRRGVQPRRRRPAGAEARQHLRGVLPLRGAARPAGRRRPRAALRARAARQSARLARLRAGAAQDARRTRTASRSAARTGAGSRRRTATRTRPRPPPRSRTCRSSARSPTGCSRGCSTRCCSGARWWRPTGSAPIRRSRARSSERAAVLRRQLAGRDRGRRADRGRAGLRPRRARRARHELLDAAAALGRLRAVPRRCSRAVRQPARPRR